MAPESRMEVVVIYAPAARQVCEWTLDLPAGATVGDALQASGLMTRFPELDWAQPRCVRGIVGEFADESMRVTTGVTIGVWGRKAQIDQVLRAQDRVEVYRALRVDPKVARRERFNQQGARTAGLFAKRRAGAKAGY